MYILLLLGCSYSEPKHSAAFYFYYIQTKILRDHTSWCYQSVRSFCTYIEYEIKVYRLVLK